LKALGGGGTDFAPVFKHVEEQGIEAACLVYLTDMYGSFPKSAPDYPVLWVSTSHIDNAPFGEVLSFPRG
jgi:predicted metal-dependent peptidase